MSLRRHAVASTLMRDSPCPALPAAIAYIPYRQVKQKIISPEKKILRITGVTRNPYQLDCGKRG